MPRNDLMGYGEDVCEVGYCKNDYWVTPDPSYVRTGRRLEEMAIFTKKLHKYIRVNKCGLS